MSLVERYVERQISIRFHAAARRMQEGDPSALDFFVTMSEHRI